MTQILLDANAILRFLLRDIPDQFVKVEGLLKKAKAGQIRLIIPQIIVFEVVFALDKYYHFAKDEIVDKVESMMAAKYLQIDDRVAFKQALKFFRTHNISLTDGFMLALHRQKTVDVFTFDKNLKDLLDEDNV